MGFKYNVFSLADYLNSSIEWLHVVMYWLFLYSAKYGTGNAHCRFNLLFLRFLLAR